MYDGQDEKVEEVYKQEGNRVSRVPKLHANPCRDGERNLGYGLRTEIREDDYCLNPLL